MKYFLDTEFYEDGRTIDMISIGIVAEDGREFYEVNADFDWDRLWMPADWRKAQWLRDNVLPQIDRVIAVPKSQIRENLLSFLSPDKPEFWGFYAATDWVAFYQIWGRLVDLPSHFPKWCRDIKQFAQSVGNPQLPYDPKIHHALEDARWQKQAYDFLVEHVEYVKKQNPVIELNKVL